MRPICLGLIAIVAILVATSAFAQTNAVLSQAEKEKQAQAAVADVQASLRNQARAQYPSLTLKECVDDVVPLLRVLDKLNVNELEDRDSKLVACSTLFPDNEGNLAMFYGSQALVNRKIVHLLLMRLQETPTTSGGSKPRNP